MRHGTTTERVVAGVTLVAAAALAGAVLGWPVGAGRLGMAIGAVAGGLTWAGAAVLEVLKRSGGDR